MNSEKRFRILVVGCGHIANEWMDYTMQRSDCEIVGLVDVNPGNANKMVEKYGLKCKIFDNIDSALKESLPNLVYDITYVYTHVDVVTASIKAGCNVFGEKPMAFTLEQAEEMVKTANACGKTYSVLQNRRYLKDIRALKEFITSGAIGKVGLICADIFVGEDLRSIRNQLEKPMLQDNSIHTFDQARFITGTDAVSVYCHSFNPEGSKYNGDAAGICTFEMSDGSIFNFRCWLGAEGCHTSWEAQWRILGSKGTAIWDGFGTPYCEVADTSSGQKVYKRIDGTTSWNGKQQHAGCIEEMFTALIEGRKAETDCSDNIKSIAMVFSSIESSKSGKKVNI